MSLTASAGVSPSATTAAPAAAEVAVPAVGNAGAQAAPIPVAPAATPVVVTSVETEVAPEPGSDPDRPVVHAGPGPATPVEGATTLIDPLVIER